MGIGMMRRHHVQKPQEVVVPVVETPKKPATKRVAKPKKSDSVEVKVDEQ